MDGQFHEVIQNEKLVFTSAALDDNGARLFDIFNTITFTEEDGKTKLTLHFRILNVKADGQKKIAGMEIGWNMSLDKLNDFTKQKI